VQESLFRPARSTARRSPTADRLLVTAFTTGASDSIQRSHPLPLFQTWVTAVRCEPHSTVRLGKHWARLFSSRISTARIAAPGSARRITGRANSMALGRQAENMALPSGLECGGTNFNPAVSAPSSAIEHISSGVFASRRPRRQERAVIRRARQSATTARTNRTAKRRPRAANQARERGRSRAKKVMPVPARYRD
jgi:hypothetical protein